MTSYVDTRHHEEAKSKVVEASVGNLYKGIMADEGHVGEEKPKESVNR